MGIGNRKKESISLCYAILALMYLGVLVILLMLLPTVDSISQFFAHVLSLWSLFVPVIALVITNSALVIWVWQLPAAGKHKKRLTILLAFALALVSIANAALAIWTLGPGIMVNPDQIETALSLVIVLGSFAFALIYIYQALGVFFIFREHGGKQS